MSYYVVTIFLGEFINSYEEVFRWDEALEVPLSKIENTHWLRGAIKNVIGLVYAFA